MPPILTRKRIRLQVLADQEGPIKDYLTGATPSIWRGNDVQIELGLFFGAEVVGVTNLTSVTIEAKLSQTSVLDPVISKTVSVLDNTLDTASWVGKSKQHASVVLTAEETNLDLGGKTEENYWLTVSAITTEGYSITLGVSTLQVREDNAGVAGDPPPTSPTYLTAAETTALVAGKVSTAELAAALKGTATASWESGVWPIDNATDVVTIPFAVTKTSASYHFLSLYVRNLSGDAVKAPYFASPTAQTDEEFTVKLSGETISGNYELVWHVVLDA